MSSPTVVFFHPIPSWISVSFITSVSCDSSLCSSPWVRTSLGLGLPETPGLIHNQPSAVYETKLRFMFPRCSEDIILMFSALWCWERKVWPQPVNHLQGVWLLSLGATEIVFAVFQFCHLCLCVDLLSILLSYTDSMCHGPSGGPPEPHLLLSVPLVRCFRESAMWRNSPNSP